MYTRVYFQVYAEIFHVQGRTSALGILFCLLTTRMGQILT
jgi:hypothetical protein